MLIRTAYLILIIIQANTAIAGPGQNLAGEINSSDSYFHVLVYSDGLLSGFGHDHVIAASNWRSHYQLNNEGQLQASLQFRAQDLIVDRKRDRVLYPRLADKRQPSEDDIAGTKKNMLSKALLDEKNHPVILARINTNIKHKKMTLRLTLGGHETITNLAYKMSCKNEIMTTKGTFRINHEDLNLKPFTALFGTIKVAEALDFAFSVSIPFNCKVLAST